MAEPATLQDVVEDVRTFFLSPQHWIYHSSGTASLISPNSVYHVTQLELLFEDRHFHDRTYRALQRLREEGFLRFREERRGNTSAVLVWRSNIRYVERAIKSHIELMAKYATQSMNKATGDYAETLALMGLSRLHLDLVSRDSNSYQAKIWKESDHNLDFIMERVGIGYGIEIKNTFDYFPDNELETKLKMCEYLGVLPLFIVRHRHANQWFLTKEHGGLLYIFKSKIFVPGQDAPAQEIWQQMRLPVAFWNDWPGQFYPAIENCLAQPKPDRQPSLYRGS